MPIERKILIRTIEGVRTHMALVRGDELCALEQRLQELEAAQLENQEKTFTLFWRHGERRVVHGVGIADAMNKAGYGAGSMAALDFYDNGDSQAWTWNPKRFAWEPRKDV